MGHIDLAARILHPGGHPRHDATALHYLPQYHLTRIAGQVIGLDFDPQ